MSRYWARESGDNLLPVVLHEILRSFEEILKQSSNLPFLHAMVDGRLALSEALLKNPAMQTPSIAIAHHRSVETPAQPFFLSMSD